jgi:hypothetical protein
MNSEQRAFRYVGELDAEQLLAKLEEERIVHPSGLAQVLGISGRGDKWEVAEAIVLHVRRTRAANSHTGTPGTPFCFDGHVVDPATSWRLIRMTLTEETRQGRYLQDENGKWYRDPPAVWVPDENAPGSMIVCQFHDPGPEVPTAVTRGLLCLLLPACRRWVKSGSLPRSSLLTGSRNQLVS